MNKKLKEIYEGWKNYTLYQLGFEDPEVEKIAKERAEICSLCSFNVASVCSKRKKTTVDGEEIRGCGCPIEKKVRSMNSNCPKKLWLAREESQNTI